MSNTNSKTILLPNGVSIMNAFGERENMGTTATGEDVWRGTATTIPIPSSSGEQMTLVSDDTQDTTLGTGARRIKLHYIQAVTGAEMVETVDLDGTTPVDTVATDIMFINDIYTVLTGSNGVAEGDIIVYKKGAASTIYSMISAGGNKAMIPNRMVPAGHTLVMKGWHCEEAQGKRCAIRIRSTDMRGVLLPVFCFKDVAYLKQTASGMLELNDNIPALSIIKVSAWPDQAAAETSCSWWGELWPNSLI